MKLAIKGLKKRLKDNKNTISDLIYKLTQAKLKIKQLTLQFGASAPALHADILRSSNLLRSTIKQCKISVAEGAYLASNQKACVGLIPTSCTMIKL